MVKIFWNHIKSFLLTTWNAKNVTEDNGLLCIRKTKTKFNEYVLGVRVTYEYKFECDYVKIYSISKITKIKIIP